MNILAAATYEELVPLLPYHLELIDSGTMANSMVYVHKGPPAKVWHNDIRSGNTVFIMFMSDRFVVSLARSKSDIAQVDILYCDPEAVETVIATIYSLFGDTPPTGD